MDDSEMLRVKLYSVLLGFSLIICLIFPCVLLAFFSKYLPKRNPPLKDSYRALRKASNISESVERCVQYSHNRLTFVQKLGGFGTCSELWKVYLPEPNLPPRLSRDSTRYREDESTAIHTVACVRRLQENQGAHAECLKSEFNLMYGLPAHPHLLNLVGLSTNSRRPSFLPPGSSQTDPAGLLFEYPSYGQLYTFLCHKRQAVNGNHNGKWSVLSQQTDLERPCSAPPLVTGRAVKSSYARWPFLQELSEPIEEFSILVFALQILSAMEYLASKKILHKRLCSECVAVTKDFDLKVTDIDFEVQTLHKNTFLPSLKKTPAGRRVFKWDAPEVLTCQEHSEKSEVWRFGMTLWEITSLGETPFKEIQDLQELSSILVKGERPQKIRSTSECLYQIMECCWDLHPAARPTFKQLHNTLQKEFDSRSTALAYDLSIEFYHNSPADSRRGSLTNHGASATATRGKRPSLAETGV